MESVYECIKKRAEEGPARVAIVSKSSSGDYRPTTYGDLLRHIDSYCQFVQNSSRPGQVVPLLLQPGAELVAAMMGVLAAGRFAAPLNIKLRGPQIAQILSSDKVGSLIVDNAGLMALHNSNAAEKHGETLNELHWTEHAGDSNIHHKIFEKLSQSHNTKRLELPTEPSTTPLRTPNGSSGMCLFTSGSTGTPKGVLICQSDVIARSIAEIECYKISQDDVLLNLLPFSFDVGLNQLTCSLLAGAMLVIAGSWLPADITKLLNAYDVTGISGVPAIWNDVLKSGLTLENNSLRYITVSGGDLPVNQLQQLPSLKSDLQIFKTYGQTEAFRVAILKPHEFESKTLSVGQPFGSARFSVVRDDGSEADPNEPGEIIHMGLGTMIGYLSENDSPEKIRPNPLKHLADSHPHVVYTGDLGYIDQQGYLFLQSRIDDMVKIQGNRVYPAELATEFHQIDHVTDAQVIGIKSSDGNSVLVAFVVVSDPSTNSQSLSIALKKRVPSYMLPRHIEICDALPRTATGKPDRKTLENRAAGILKINVTS